MELFDPFLEEAESFIECPIINWKEGSIFNKTSDDDSSWLNDLMLLQIKTQQIIQGVNGTNFNQNGNKTSAYYEKHKPMESNQIRSSLNLIQQHITTGNPEDKQNILSMGKDFADHLNNKVHIIQKGNSQILKFSLRVNIVQSNDIILCTIPFLQSSIISTLEKYKSGKILKSIPLDDLRPRQLVIVSSSTNDLSRAIVNALHGDDSKNIHHVTVSFVDTPGGETVKEVFNCPKELSSQPYALLRVKLRENISTKEANQKVTVKHLQRNELREFFCDAIEGSTIFGIFGEVID